MRCTKENSRVLYNKALRILNQMFPPTKLQHTRISINLLQDHTSGMTLRLVPLNDTINAVQIEEIFFVWRISRYNLSDHKRNEEITTSFPIPHVSQLRDRLKLSTPISAIDCNLSLN